jgi:hypothetical protein
MGMEIKESAKGNRDVGRKEERAQKGTGLGTGLGTGRKRAQKGGTGTWNGKEEGVD